MIFFGEPGWSSNSGKVKACKPEPYDISIALTRLLLARSLVFLWWHSANNSRHGWRLQYTPSHIFHLGSLLGDKHCIDTIFCSHDVAHSSLFFPADLTIRLTVYAWPRVVSFKVLIFKYRVHTTFLKYLIRNNILVFGIFVSLWKI